ncbi:MAG TPA: glycoside hydrolase family 32 protein [Terriglobales bacterium]|nr:glycoside hydrolase family 32 protein [Terriglobales bacterium]
MDRREFIFLTLSAAAAAHSLGASDMDDPALRKAMQAVIDAIPTASADRNRPVYHFAPPANWTNDPNGTIYYGGWHHLFYQFNPFATRLDNQHWGHARSRDLVNWEHLPIAIWPSLDRGEKAIFSGGAAIAADGRPRLLYTSIGDREPEQWLVSPKDAELITWAKFPRNPVLTQAAHASGPIAQWRDPFMFRKDGETYMVCGGGTRTGRAQVQLYRATKDDLTQWKHLGPIFQTLDRDVRNFECPNLFPLDGKWVMIVSPNGVCEYWIGDLDIACMRFEPSAHAVLDSGDAYASNISVDEKGRTLLWLWGRTDPHDTWFNPSPEVSSRRWAGVITMPRVLSIGSDGYLQQRPAQEFETLRGAPESFAGLVLERTTVLKGLSADCAEFEAEFSGAGTFGLELRRSAQGKSGIVVAIETSFRGTHLTVGNARAYVGNADRYNVRVFLDKRCVEVFVNDGTTALYNWFEAAPNDLEVAVFGQPAKLPPFLASKRPLPPAPRLESLTVWPMKPAKFSLDRFVY